jgi:small-conductance mechanosensitive channel
MPRPARTLRALGGALVLLSVAAAPGTAPAQAPAAERAAEAPAPPPPEEGPYPLAEITQRSEQVRSLLPQLRERLQVPERIERMQEELPRQVLLIQDARRNTRDHLASGTLPTRTLDDLEASWLVRQQDLAAAREALTKWGTAIDRELATLDQLVKRWKATRAAALESEESVAVDQIDATLAEIGAAQDLARERAKAHYGMREQLAGVEEVVAGSLARVREVRGQQRANLLTRDAPALWEMQPLEDMGAGLATMRAEWRQNLVALGAYLTLRQERLRLHIALTAATLLLTLSLRRRAQTWGEDSPELAEGAQIFRRPFSVTLLLALSVSGFFYPAVPFVLRRIVGILLLLPALRVLPPLVSPGLRPAIYGLAAFLLSAELRQFLEPAPLFARLLLVAELCAALGILAWLGWRWRQEGAARVPRALRELARPLALLLAFALLTNLAGYVGLSRLLEEGLLLSAYAAAIAYGAYRIAQVFLAVLLQAGFARKLRAVRVAEAGIERWVTRFLRAGAALWWAWTALDFFAIRDSALALLKAVLTTPLRLGTVEISLGIVLVFVATIFASFLISRFVRFVLEEEVFPRVVVERGASNAIATTLHYAILLVGFFLAAAAAGMDLGRVTLLAGAFGVGIGFGLQNVVNNFVSGLILLFERPVQVGDTIEVGGLQGEVRRIGPRSSTLRTFDGAEVIVPNGTLISDLVTNWTLSDRRRRLTLAVGVAYGTDPERVLEILRSVARESELVLQDPEPLCLFKGFGESSLDFELRCWIPRYEEGLVATSQLLSALHGRLRDAGIEIPFPQRDLHLRSVDPAALQALAEAGAGEAESQAPPRPRRDWRA